MTKTKDKNPQLKDTRDKETKDKELKGKGNLVGRVKKVIKKSRRKLGEEKFEKELQRTIEFLAQLQTKLDNSHGAGESGKALAKVEKKSAQRAGKKVEQKVARNAPKKPQHGKKKPAGNGVGKKRKGAPIEDASPAAESRAALQAKATSNE
jgi:exonuclease VII small subunit